MQPTLSSIPRLTTNLLITLKLLALFGIFLYDYPLYLLLIFIVLICISVTGEFFSSYAEERKKHTLLSAIYTGLALIDALVFAAVLIVFRLFASDFYLLGLLSLIVIPFRGGLWVGFLSGVLISFFYLALGWKQIPQMSLMLRTASLLAVCLASGYWGELLQQETRLRRKAQKQTQKLKELNQLKNEFISTAVHNLRSPLTSLKGYWEVLSEEDLPVAEKKGFLQQMRSVLANLERLVDDMLEISRLRVGKITGSRQRVNVKPLLLEIFNAFKPAAEAKKLNFIIRSQLTSPAWLKIDPQMFKNTLSNLLDNAVKYTGCGKVELKIWTSEGWLHLEISDTGVGIPEEDQKNIFRPFYRGQTKEQKRFKGTGLGLYIVKKFVDSNNGQISFVSEQDKGTTFTLSFPLVSGEEFLRKI